jgi:hypothetical protein
VSRAPVIAGVTAALKALLEGGAAAHGLPESIRAALAVSALPPDRVPLDGPDARPRLNLFLHRVAYDTSLRNLPLRPRDASMAHASRSPLAVHLHYLVTAYGTAEMQAELLLGYAMVVLNENTVLSSELIRRAGQPFGFTDHVEPLQLVLHSPDGEEMSRVWSALQARCRPSLACEVRGLRIE